MFYSTRTRARGPPRSHLAKTPIIGELPTGSWWSVVGPFSPLGRRKALFGGLGPPSGRSLALLCRSWPRLGVAFSSHFQVFYENSAPSTFVVGPQRKRDLCHPVASLGHSLGSLGLPWRPLGVPWPPFGRPWVLLGRPWAAQRVQKGWSFELASRPRGPREIIQVDISAVQRTIFTRDRRQK